jgi:hypothetical protein
MSIYEVNVKIIIDANSIEEVGKAVDKIADMVKSDKVVVTNDINIRKV